MVFFISTPLIITALLQRFLAMHCDWILTFCVMSETGRCGVQLRKPIRRLMSSTTYRQPITCGSRQRRLATQSWVVSSQHLWMRWTRGLGLVSRRKRVGWICGAGWICGCGFPALWLVTYDL